MLLYNFDHVELMPGSVGIVPGKFNGRGAWDDQRRPPGDHGVPSEKDKGRGHGGNRGGHHRGHHRGHTGPGVGTHAHYGNATKPNAEYTTYTTNRSQFPVEPSTHLGSFVTKIMATGTNLLSTLPSALSETFLWEDEDIIGIVKTVFSEESLREIKQYMDKNIWATLGITDEIFTEGTPGVDMQGTKKTCTLCYIT